MEFQPVVNAVQLEVIGTYHGERVENTFYYERATLPTQAQLQTLVNTLDAYIGANWLTYLPDEWSGVQVYAKGLTTPADVQASSIGILGDPGTAGDGMPGNVTIAIKRISGLTGRSARGRIYWQAIPEAQVSGNVLDTGYANALRDLVDGLDAQAVTLGWVPVIVSRTQAGVTPANAITYPIVDWALENYFLDSMRRRLAGRGT